MLRDGYYDVTYATLKHEGSVRVRFQGGILTGLTDRGTTLEGTCLFDAQRNTIRFDVVATVPANQITVTGVAIGDQPRKINFKGETPASSDAPRFSIDFAGRAIDIVSRYTGPL